MNRNTSLFHPRTIDHALTHLPATIPADHKRVLQGWANIIRSSEIKRQNETNYDSVFIQQIMVGILGYKDFSPGEHCTLKKNVPVGGGNVDIALGKFSEGETVIIAPFELKGAKTWNLDAIMPGRHKTPVQQAWEYAMDAPGARWVLVSNYLEIRLYAVGYGRADYECFDLSTLSNPEEYQRFILLLSAENLLGTLTLELLKASEEVGKDITNKLYDDYRRLRETLITSLKTDNPDVSELNIISYTQTLLDRILFIAFAQDRGLIPRETLKKTFETQNPYHPVPIWENFKGLFRAIDKGSSPLNIPGYNGGLFAYDEGIESLQLSDSLCGEFKKLGDYDFESDVSVNILGHIFEQSITDLEEIKAWAATGDVKNFDKKTSKRKKDGIFYTPPYITRYIVEQAVGGWLNDRKKEIGFDELPELADADYATIQLNTRGKSKGKVTYNKKIEQHMKAWEVYQEVLSSIKVLDPACGSGAFLNEVFDYLYREGQLVNNELTILNAGQAKLFRWDTHILANNIYGVDINRESVEITKLSLWLKTANRSERLTYLDDNIKCGNSLIDDPAIAGSLAFKWVDDFSEIMNAGGFDVVIGNPPWGASFSENEKEYFRNNYSEIHMRTPESFNYFTYKANILSRGYVGLVIPSSYLMQYEFSKSRQHVVSHNVITKVINLGDGVFDDVASPSCILLWKKKQPNSEHGYYADYRHVPRNMLSKRLFEVDDLIVFNDIGANTAYVFTVSPYKDIVTKCFKYSTLKAVTEDVATGISSGLDEAFVHDKQRIESLQLEPVLLKKLVIGGEINRYSLRPISGKYILYVTAAVDMNKYPNAKHLLDEYSHKLFNRKEAAAGYQLNRPRREKLFIKPKILVRQTASRIMATYDPDGWYCLKSGLLIQLPDNSKLSYLYLLTLLNSKLINFIYQDLVGEEARIFPEVKPVQLFKLPIKEIPEKEQLQFIGKAEIMLAKNKELYDLSSKFLALLKSEFGLEKPSEKLEQWYMLDFTAFMAELVKKKISLSLAQKTEWMEYFDKQRAIAAAIKTTIAATDREIDQMVYALYALTPDEIAIVEKAVHSNLQ